MKRMLWPLLVLVIAGVWLAWWMSPRQVVKRQTRGLVGFLTFTGGTGPGLLEMHALAGLLDHRVDIEVPVLDVGARRLASDDIQSGYAWLRRRAKESAFDVAEIHEVVVDAGRATVSATLEGMLVMPPGLRVVDGRSRVDFAWRRGDSGWRLAGLVWHDSR